MADTLNCLSLLFIHLRLLDVNLESEFELICKKFVLFSNVHSF